MSKPPIKAMETIKRYCEKKKNCKGCPLYVLSEYGYCLCSALPENWEIKKEGNQK